MAKQTIFLGTTAGDNTGTTLRAGGDMINDNFDELYGATGWESRVDTTNTQTIPSTTMTIIPITIGLESNGGIPLLDANSKIVPIRLGDLLHADFSVTVVTPSGVDNYVNISFVVNGVTYRSVTFPLVKGTGIDENCSVSFSLPVGSFFFTNGGTFQIYASTGVTIKNRYIAVSLQHKAL
jgi:hypothetical protein